jgi:hypothetical protein
MTTQLNLGVADAHRADLLREARLARLASDATGHESLFRRALAMIQACTGRTLRAHAPYEAAPTAR